MKKPLLKLTSALLSATMFLSSVALFNTTATETKQTTSSAENSSNLFDKLPTFRTGDKSLSVETPADVDVISSAEDYYNTAIANGADLKVSAGTNNLPASIDNSQSPYFPPVGNQGSIGSCVAWAQVYYQFTYTMNKQRNVPSTAENAYSPKFVYNIANDAIDNGLIYNEAYDILKYNGAPTLSTLPYDDNWLSWSTTEEVWLEAIKSQIKSYQKFEDIGTNETQITSADDEDLITIKTALANEEVLAFSTFAYSFTVEKLKTNASAPENAKFEGQEVVTHLYDSQGAHRMALVGYNDNIWTDINKNNVVDKGEMGAFKIVNSWGPDYGNKGFIWVAYDALNEDSAVTTEVEKRTPIFNEVTRIDAQPYNYSGDFYLKTTINTQGRYQAQFYLEAEKNGTVIESAGIASMGGLGNKVYGYDGSLNAVDGTFIIPLKNSAPDLTADNFENYTWSVKFVDGLEGVATTTIKNAELVNAKTGKTYTVKNTFPFTIENEERKIEFLKSNLKDIVVYYRGYDNPTLHYNLNGSWSSAPLEYTLERRGHLYKYVIPCSLSSTASIYFTDENGNTDNNSGNNYKASSGLNYFNTDSFREPLKAILQKETDDGYDTNKCISNSGEAVGGYEPYLYQFEITNLDTGKISNYKYNDSQSASNTGLRVNEEGNYRITLRVKDFSETVVTDSIDIYVKNEPFIFKEVKLLQGDKVVAGQPVEIYANTKYENVKSWGNIKSLYKIVVKKGDEVCYENERRSTSFSLMKKSSTTIEEWTPYETGLYTVTVSSEDGDKTYAEGSYTFEVKDHQIGDVDCNTVINIRDATLLQMFIAKFAGEDEINQIASDTNKDTKISISDATAIQMSVAHLDSSSYVGDVIPVEKPIEPTTVPTEPVTQPKTEPVTDPVTDNKVYFTNSHKWSGTIYCYYWSDSNSNMTSWPGTAMTFAETNQFGESVYVFDVPAGANNIIFSNGNAQTVDIKYSGGIVKYYPLTTTDNQGHYQVETW